jgi:Domain of Unknown Function (DUF1080)
MWVPARVCSLSLCADDDTCKVRPESLNLTANPMKSPNTLMSSFLIANFLFTGAGFVAFAADQAAHDQEPPVVNPGPIGGPPSDAVVLFDGKDLSQFRGERSPEPKWNLQNGVMETTPLGGILSKQEFADCQVHVEWAEPSVVKGDGQGRGNSGVYTRRHK